MRPRHEDDSAPSLDSFLDILTNLIGVMVLIAVLSVITSQHIEVWLGTPILREAPEHSDRVLFECREGRVVFLDEKKMRIDAERMLRDHLSQENAIPTSVEELNRILQTDDAGDDCYRVRVEWDSAASTEGGDQEVLDALAWIYEPRSVRRGETESELRRGKSEYRKQIDSLDPQAEFAFFIVRPDGFEVFRLARKLARDRGVATGWYPHRKDEQLRFTATGQIGREIQP